MHGYVQVFSVHAKVESYAAPSSGAPRIDLSNHRLAPSTCVHSCPVHSLFVMKLR